MKSKISSFQVSTGFILIMMVVALLTACRPGSTPATAQPPTEQAQIPETGNETTINLDDQISSETILVVPGVVSIGPGWLAIHAQESGDIGPVIGFAPLKNGTNKNLVVEIDKAKATEIVYAVVHEDSGKAGAFEFPGEDQPSTKPGSMAVFRIELDLEKIVEAESRVQVADQDVQDGMVEVAEVVSKVPGWLAIHTQDAGSLGAVIGMVPVDTGSTKNVMVRVDPARATETLFAVLHSDIGKAGVFEFPASDGLLEEGGVTVGAKFTTSEHPSAQAALSPQSSPTQPGKAAATESSGASPEGEVEPTASVEASPNVTGTVQAASTNPTLTVSNQELSDGSVKVDLVISNGPGWLVIYNQANRQPGEILGYTAVQDGENRDFTVQIDTGKATGTNYAVLHVDAGTFGQAEFPGPDVPATNGIQLVLSSFQVDLHAMHAETPSADAIPIVIALDQEINDGKIKIEEVISQGPGWVVIYTDVFDQPGEIIGFSPVKEGENTDVIVQVDVEKLSDELYAVLHVDSGTVGEFDHPGPDTAWMQGDEIVRTSFKTQAGEMAADTTPEPDQGQPSQQPSLFVEDQAIRGGTVKVASTYSLTWGFMTIHNQNTAGAFGPIIGWTPVKAGENKDIIVKIDLTKATETMYAMLHVDQDPAGVLEFPGPDKPVMVMDQMVALPFNITGGLPGTDVLINVTNAESPYLVDTEEMSLYFSLNDQPGVNNCNEDCQKNWLPLLAIGKLIPGEGVSGSKLGVIVLPDGRRQVTYANQPLYYYIGDEKPGDTLGHGVDGLWFLATP